LAIVERDKEHVGGEYLFGLNAVEVSARGTHLPDRVDIPADIVRNYALIACRSAGD
jgi:hypothetical protein